MAQDRKDTERAVQNSKARQKQLSSEQQRQGKYRVETAKTAGEMETPKVRLLGVGTTRSSKRFIKSIRRLRGLYWLRKLLKQPQVPLLIPLNPWIRRRLLEALRSELSSSLGSCGLFGRGFSIVIPRFL